MRRGAAAPAWILVGPALGVLAVFFVVPVLASFILSLTDFDVYAIGRLDRLRVVGADNYVALLFAPRFWTALRNTLYFVLVGGPLSILLSLGAALLLDARAVRWKPLFRTVLFVPVVTTLVAVAIVWRSIYHPRAGLLAWLCAQLGVTPADWLGDPAWAMPAIILLAVWKNFGFNMLVFLAGLQSVPERLHEAARLDGAGAWQRFRHVTLPVLAPTFGFVVVTTSIGYLQLFAEPYVMTQGGPAESTLSIVLLMYEEGFRWWNLGYAAAIAFVLFGIILAVTGMQLGARRLFAREQAP
jgi:multiple sugar transport system permease protein